MRTLLHVAFTPEGAGRCWNSIPFTRGVPAEEVKQELLVQGEFLLCFSLSDFPNQTPTY